jgi:hypothetical protein
MLILENHHTVQYSSVGQRGVVTAAMKQVRENNHDVISYLTQAVRGVLV